MGFFSKKDQGVQEDVGKQQQKQPEPSPSGAPPPAAKSAPAVQAPASYGIDNVIELMRSLPLKGNPELVVEVIKKTLESTQISIETIVHEATTKQRALEDRAKQLLAEGGALRAERDKLRQMIQLLQAEFDETSEMMEYLQLSTSGPA